MSYLGGGVWLKPQKVGLLETKSGDYKSEAAPE